MQAAKRLSESVCNQFASAVREANGNEVFAVGTTDAAGIVTGIKICARGNADAVPVTKETKNAAATVLIHNHPSTTLTPSEADLSVASVAARNGQGFYIVDNECRRLYVVAEPVMPHKIKKLNIEKTGLLLSAGGALDALSAEFDERPSQIELTKSVARSFNDSLIGVFEAGTGVGKSFAYLLPSIEWALYNKERVVVSTGTINLQQQLIEKDIPFAEKIIGKKVKAVLMKGRQNYICRRRLADANVERDLFDEDAPIGASTGTGGSTGGGAVGTGTGSGTSATPSNAVDQFEAICAWAETTQTGSRSDLSFFPLESVWSRVNSESDACMGLHCPYHDSCFIMKVRKAAADAQLIVVNHHLLFADLEARLMGAGYDDTAVLPPFRHIVFDEAHGMESAATSFFSEQLNRFKIIKQLNLLYRKRRMGASGHLFPLEALSSRSDKAEEVPNATEKVKRTLEALEDEALLLMPYEFTWRLYDKTCLNAAPLLRLMSVLREDIATLVGLFRSIITGIDDKDADHPAVWETKQILSRLEGAGSVCGQFVEWSERRDTIFWLDKVRSKAKKGSGIYPRFYATPLDIAPMMQKGVFEPLSTVVCTSATLKTGESFNFWLHRSGAQYVDAERLLCREFASPFPYEKNMLLAVATDMPMPDSGEFQAAVEKAVVTLINAAGGRTLVLFTSYESLTRACEYARAALSMHGITVLRQGEDDRFRLLETFKKDTASVLFATDSFWQGVDVPGEALSQVIIVKLPFTVPSDPIFAARAEAIEQKGGNPFMDLSVPEAVIRFRQGFGRLMRRSDDRGAVVVLDRRIVEKRYGRIFVASVPRARFVTDTVRAIADKVASFV